MKTGLVTGDWLERQLGAADLAVVDATFFLPGSERDAAAEFVAAHIPGARRMDLDAVADPAFPGAHRWPDAATFGAAMNAIGVGRDDRIIVYDHSPLHSAARGWMMLRHFGADQVAVLDGGLAQWIAEGRPLEAGKPMVRRARFDPAPRAGEIVTKRDLIYSSGVPIADPRPPARFEGREPDLRPGIASGHIPGSRNIPLGELYRLDGTLRPAAELAATFAAAGIDPLQPFIASCGSGITACSLILAAATLGGREARLYPGSWAEWGADPNTPKAVGPA